MSASLALRCGDNKATVKDIVDLRKYFNVMFRNIDKLRVSVASANDEICALQELLLRPMQQEENPPPEQLPENSPVYEVPILPSLEVGLAPRDLAEPQLLPTAQYFNWGTEGIPNVRRRCFGPGEEHGKQQRNGTQRKPRPKRHLAI